MTKEKHSSGLRWILRAKQFSARKLAPPRLAPRNVKNDETEDCDTLNSSSTNQLEDKKMKTSSASPSKIKKSQALSSEKSPSSVMMFSDSDLNCDDSQLDFDSALSSCDLALSEKIEELGSNHLDVADLYVERAKVYEQMFDLHLATEDYKAASKIVIKELDMKDPRVKSILKKLASLMEQQHTQDVEQNMSSRFYQKKTADLRCSIRNLMSGIDDFMLDFEDDMEVKEVKHRPHAKTWGGAEFDCIGGSLSNLFQDFENKLDAELDIEKDITKDPVEPDVVM